MAHKLAELGYIVVNQDVRGRYASDGEFRPGFFSPYHCEAEDGYDSVEWFANLPWSTGKVGTFGASYLGWTQWELAPTKPPHLRAMMPQAIAANLLDRELSGVLRLGRVLWWTANTLSPDLRQRSGGEWGPRTPDDAGRMWTERDRSKWLWYLPLKEIPDDVIFGLGKHWRRWLADHVTDYFGFEGKHRNISVPALITTGWYDQQIGSIKHFTGMSLNGNTNVARKGTRLIIGPWTHAGAEWSSRVGEVDFGSAGSKDFYETANHWFSRWLKNENIAPDSCPPIQLFVMGANKWRGEHEWPLSRTVYTDFFLHSKGQANLPNSNGMLSHQPPMDEPKDQYLYDPRDPVMSLYTPYGQNEPQDQRSLDGRQDVLVYSTPPLEKAIEVTGPITVKLWASSSALDKDFVGKFIDVWPSGFAQELCYGIVRARYRNSFTTPCLLQPGHPYEFTININPTSNLFREGHRIRLDISSSDFPNFDRNHNTGGDDYAESTLITAKQTIFHDRTRPSKIILPIIS